MDMEEDNLLDEEELPYMERSPWPQYNEPFVGYLPPYNQSMYYPVQEYPVPIQSYYTAPGVVENYGIETTYQQQQHIDGSIYPISTPETGTEQQRGRKLKKITDIYIAFVIGENTNSTKSWKNWMNWAVTLSGGYSHCELVFKMDDKSHIACTVHYGEPVNFETKKYPKDKWHMFNVRVDPDKADDIYNFCAAQNGKDFNTQGLYMNFIPVLNWFPVNNHGKTWFCSELCLAALQVSMEEYRQYPCWKTPPTKLYQIMLEHGDYIADVFDETIYETLNTSLKFGDENV